MPDTRREDLFGWGHNSVRECLSWRPEKHRDLDKILQTATTAIARGQGLSYGDASLQPEGVVLTGRLNHFIYFDSQKGIVRAQAGVSLAELMGVAIPRGWFPPIIPGTRHVTLGGAFASNVHGKNHYLEGDFADHVLAIRLLLANGESIECSPTNNREIFWATAGGMGMTGIIEQLTLKLKPITSSSLSSITFRVDSMEEMVSAFEQYRNNADYMVGWIDHMARSDETGRGIFEAASHITPEDGGAPLESFVPEAARITVPMYLPSFVLNRYSMAIYNILRFHKISAWRKAEQVNFNDFFHPLDRIGEWYRLYGKRGFFQYQCMFPESPEVVAQMRTFLSAIQRKKLFSFLAVMKYHRKGKGFLTFPQAGYSIAFDFPNTWRVRALLPQLDRWVADHGGRVYLAKDSTLSPEQFRLMYGQSATEWLNIIHEVDPQSKFTSLMSERLEWKPGA